MKKLLTLLLVFWLFPAMNAQTFFKESLNREKSHIILMNPTAGNLETVNFLIKNNVLKINEANINFVGVYHASQVYDFSKSAVYIKEKGLDSYYLHEVTGDLSEESLFMENSCTDEFANIFRNSDGIIFFGGADIPPTVYGEDNLYSSTNDTVRHYFEVSFLFHLIGGSWNSSWKPLLEENPGYLITGFCLGMQSLNVAAGGTLYQDIPAQIYNSHTPEAIIKLEKNNLHRNYWQNISTDNYLMGNNLHPVRFTEHPFFGTAVKISKKTRPLIYSSHHQGVKRLGEGLDITALSPDGKVIEALAHKKFPNVFAVQFHPEVPALYADGSPVKFNPDDEPRPLHRIMDRKSLRFHRKYWLYISEIIKKD